MTWFKVDDSLAFNSKIVAAGTSLTLWTRAGAWSAQQLSDGFVPAHMVPMLGTVKMAKQLVAVGLWEDAEDGYQFHDWADYQPLRADVEERRRVRAEAGAKGGRASGSARGRSNRQASAEASASPLLDTRANPRPDPSRPDPTEQSTHSFDGADAPSNPSPRAGEGFDTFWAAYPRKQGKGDARKAWEQKRCSRIADVVTLGARRYAADPNRDDAYTKLPAGWLRDERWEDGPVAPRAPQSRQEAEQRRVDGIFDSALDWAREADEADRQALEEHHNVRAINGGAPW